MQQYEILHFNMYLLLFLIQIVLCFSYQSSRQLWMQVGKRIIPQGKPRLKELPNPNRLKIIGGKAKGLRIDSPDVYLRPMMAKVKEAIFNTMTHLGYFESGNTRVLDVFSGAGSVGLEALSRGANFATFVDLSKVCIETSLNNAKKCKFEHQVSCICSRAEDLFANPTKYQDFLRPPYQIVTLTPPYQEVNYPTLLDSVCHSGLIEENTLILVEYPVEMGSLPFFWGNNQQWIGLRNRRYGRTVLAMYVNQPTASFDFHEDEFADHKLYAKKPE